MKQPPFRWIETFRIIAGAGSMTDAAKILGVDQSAMSRHGERICRRWNRHCDR